MAKLYIDVPNRDIELAIEIKIILDNSLFFKAFFNTTIDNNILNAPSFRVNFIF